MTKIVAMLAVLAGLSHGDELRAAEMQRGNVERVPTRGVLVPIYAVWKEGAVATVVLYSPGGTAATAPSARTVGPAAGIS